MCWEDVKIGRSASCEIKRISADVTFRVYLPAHPLRCSVRVTWPEGSSVAIGFQQGETLGDTTVAMGPIRNEFKSNIFTEPKMCTFPLVIASSGGTVPCIIHAMYLPQTKEELMG